MLPRTDRTTINVLAISASPIRVAESQMPETEVLVEQLEGALGTQSNESQGDEPLPFLLSLLFFPLREHEALVVSAYRWLVYPARVSQGRNLCISRKACMNVSEET